MRWLPVLFATLSLAIGCTKRSEVTVHPVPPEAIIPNGLQGVDADDWRHLSQGSELYPYRMLLALNDDKTGKPFRENLERFGFIPDPESPANPTGMPIGVSVAPTRDLGIRMVGINCAACHTTLLEKDGKAVLQIDGGQNLFDIRGFIGGLASSTQATFEDPAKLFGFVSRLVQDEVQTAQADAALPAAPARFSARLLGATENVLLKNATTLEEFEARGPVEKQFAVELRKIVAEENKKPVKSVEASLQSVRANPELAHFAARFNPNSAPNRAALTQMATQLRQAAHGDPLAGVGEFTDLAAIEPGPASPLRNLTTPAARSLEIRSRIGNIIDTLRLLKARYEFLVGLNGQYKDAAGNIISVASTDALPGRVDAFGSARNKMFGGPPFNAPVDLTAPVNFPHLWDVNGIPWYHWDNNTRSELQRNVGEAIGVGVLYSPTNFVSTVRVDNIQRLEALAGKIKPPVWPATVFGTPDAALVARGKVVYTETKCAECHQESVTTGKFADNKYPLSVIGTDPLRATNFAKALGSKTFVEELFPLLKNVIEKNSGVQVQSPSTWRTTQEYGARPLTAIWASAPYLHNGSVPTIHDLLLPAAQRPVTFKVGMRGFDAKKLGYTEVGSSQAGVVFDTGKLGNSNKGHEGVTFGTLLSEPDRMALIEYLKTR